LGPGPGRPGLGLWGPARPQPSPPSSPPWSLPLWLGGKGAPLHPYIKRGPQERRAQHNSHEPLIPWPPPSTSTWPPDTSTSLSLPHGLSKGCVGERSHHLYTPSCCRVFRSLSNTIYFRNLGWIGDYGSHHDHRTCVSTWRCRLCNTRVVAPRSPLTLRSAMSTSSSMLVRERSPRI
jgi:hypothetical protein